MADDVYDGSDPRRCNAKTRSVELKENATRGPGTPCRNWAGQRTDHPGIGVCWLHGGRTSAHRSKAVVTEAKRRMVTLGEPLRDATPTTVLLNELSATAGHVAWLRETVSNLDALSSHEAEVITRLYAEERDRVTRIAEACVRAGVAEAHVRVLETQAISAVTAIRRAAERAGLGDKQLKALGAALREELSAATREARPVPSLRP